MSTFTERQIERRRVIGTYLGDISKILSTLDPLAYDYAHKITDVTSLFDGVDYLNQSMQRVRDMGDGSELAEQDLEREVTEFAQAIERVGGPGILSKVN